MTISDDLTSPLELVEWRDANFTTIPDLDWDIEEDYVCATVGWTKETELWLIVVGEVTPEGERGVTRIPWGMVLNRKKLKPVNLGLT